MLMWYNITIFLKPKGKMLKYLKFKEDSYIIFTDKNICQFSLLSQYMEDINILIRIFITIETKNSFLVE